MRKGWPPGHTGERGPLGTRTWPFLPSPSELLGCGPGVPFQTVPNQDPSLGLGFQKDSSQTGNRCISFCSVTASLSRVSGQ